MSIITSDWHLTDKSADTIFGEVIPGVVAACVASGDLKADCLGDLLHIRYKVDAYLLNDLRDHLKAAHEAHGIMWRILPGNHDQYNVAGRNALEILDEIDCVRVFTAPAWDESGLWIPYRKNREDLLAALRLADPSQRKRTSKIAFMHHGFLGSWMNDHMVSDTGLEDAEVQDFDKVFTGHYHKHHTIGRATYIGSPYQTRADESGQDKGFVHLKSDGSWSFVPQKWGKKFHRIDLASVTDLDLDAIGPNDEVRVKAGPGVDESQVARLLIAAGVKNHVVTPTQREVEARVSVPDNAPITAYAQAYIELHATENGLDPIVLRKAYEELTS